MKVTFTASLYNKPLKDGTCPIVLLVSWRDSKSRARRKRVGESCLPDDFINGKVASYVRGSASINDRIEDHLRRAHRIYREHFEDKRWDYDAWSNLFDSRNHRITFTEFAKETIDTYLRDDKAGTGFYYRDCLRALQSHLGKNDIRFEDITKQVLKSLEQDMRDRKVKGDRTMRGLKALFGKAVEQEVVDMKLMPFRTGYNPVGYKFSHLKKLKPKTTQKIKHLSVDQIEAIKNYKPKNNAYQKAKDLWLFSYYTMGVNLKDIALLKPEHIKGDQWYFDREKTSTGYNSTFLRPECFEIMKRYGGKKYVFEEILRDGYDKSDATIKRRLNNYLSNLTRRYKQISKELDLPGYFTFYSARFSSGAKAASEGVDLRALQSAYRHASSKTTEGYLPKKVDKSVYEVL